MIAVESSVREWGNSLGLTIPKETAENLNLKAGEKLRVFIAKDRNVLRETFGTLKIKKSTQKLMEEVNKELYNE